MSQTLTAEALISALNKYASKKDAVFLQTFFKTAEGQYGYGDVFIGVRVPAIRKVCQQFSDLAETEVQKLLDSKVHEHRLSALIIMVNQFGAASEQQKQSLHRLYLINLSKNRINNWDLVDVSAEHIVGKFLENKSRQPLMKLAKSKNLWERRVAIISTFAYIKDGDPETTIKIAEVLLNDSQDLIQKAVGWMLREVGKRCGRDYLISFLDIHAWSMPRTCLRYSLEHLPKEQRLHYMKKQTAA
jgi:3-methyladenine DNA glycosylase AlkD